jgi:hypothetical protein
VDRLAKAAEATEAIEETQDSPNLRLESLVLRPSCEQAWLVGSFDDSLVLHPYNRTSVSGSEGPRIAFAYRPASSTQTFNNDFGSVNVRGEYFLYSKSAESQRFSF